MKYSEETRTLPVNALLEMLDMMKENVRESVVQDDKEDVLFSDVLLSALDVIHKSIKTLDEEINGRAN